MRGVTTSLDFIVRQSRMRAKSRSPNIQGGAAGLALAQEAATRAVDVMQGMTELEGVRKPKFILGMHGIDQSGEYVIP